MASIVRQYSIDASAPACWAALRDFGAVHKRLAPGFVTSLQMVSPTDREVTFCTGTVATERLIGIDEAAMRLAYTVVSSPLGATHHNASAQLIATGADRCRFVWITDVLPDELAGPIGAMMDQGALVIKKTLENGRPSARSSA